MCMLHNTCYEMSLLRRLTCSTILKLFKKAFPYMFQPVWPSSSVKTAVMRKLLCFIWSYFLVRSHVGAGLSLGDGRCLCVTMTAS
jgi:hypothetical protein